MFKVSWFTHNDLFPTGVCLVPASNFCGFSSCGTLLVIIVSIDKPAKLNVTFTELNYSLELVNIRK